MAQVPSNLIPLRVTQLPTAPVASEDSLMMIVYQGNNYQIRVGDLLSVAGVPISRQVIAGTGLSGGGALENNVTLSVASKGINGSLLVDTGVTAGVYGTATRIPVMTVDSTGRVTAASSLPVEVSGYVPESREIIAGAGLTGGGTLNANVTLTADLADTTPEAGFQSGSAGTAEAVSRADHKHPAVDLSSDDEVNNLLGLSNGGTARSLVPDAGAIIWCGADGLYVGPVGQSGQVLISSGTGEYTWGSALVVTPQAANTFFAGPTSGGNADPLFRAMVNADLPDSGATPGSYGSALAIPVVTVNAKGVVTSITTTSFTGGLSYKGAWNASTNTPTLVSGTGTNGDYYVVSVAGNTNLDGITDWQVGDWALFNGTVWQKVDQTNSVSSVNGEVGAVVLDYADVGAPSATGTGASGTWAIGISGNAGTVTNGVYTNVSYSDPTWLTSLSGSKVSGDIAGNAGTVTNGVYTTGSYADPTWLTSLATSKLSGTVSNVQLANSSITLNGNSISLGGSATITAANPYALTIGTGLSGTSYDGSSAVTVLIANTTVTAGSYGSASKTLTATANAQGQLTALAETDIAIANTQVSGLGTMSTQNATSVAITGGAIDGTTIGATTASSAKLTTGLVGSNANFTDFPNAQFIGSQADTGSAHVYNIGVAGEGAATDVPGGGQWGVGVYGTGATSGATRGIGIVGDGHVSNTADTAAAIGVRGYATGTHAGGQNIGLYAQATGGASNYALFMASGNIYSAVTQTWAIPDNTANALSFDTTGKAGVLAITTTNGDEKVTMSGGLEVTGSVTAANYVGITGGTF